VQKDENGQPIRPFDPGLDTLWVAEDPTAKFGEFAEHNLTNYVSAMTADIHAMSAISQVPSHYLINTTGQPASGDSLKAAEAGLVAKVMDRMQPFSDAWEEVIRLGWQVLDDPRGKITDAEMLWKSPEFRTEGELTDAMIKRVASQLSRCGRAARTWLHPAADSADGSRGQGGGAHAGRYGFPVRCSSRISCPCRDAGVVHGTSVTDPE
jgi:hypothetical protein